MKVIGFPIDTEFMSQSKNVNRDFLESLSDNQLNELALELSDAVIYDHEKEFFYALNDDLVDTENYYWFIINVK